MNRSYLSLVDRMKLALAVRLIRSTVLNVALELREVPRATKRNVLGRVVSKHTDLADALDALENTEVGEGYYNALWLRAFIGSRDDLLAIVERKNPLSVDVVMPGLAEELRAVAAGDGGAIEEEPPVEAPAQQAKEVQRTVGPPIHVCNVSGPMVYAHGQYRPSCTICGIATAEIINGKTH